MKRHRQIFIHPPHLRFDDIRRQADDFRKKYVDPPDRLPVPIEDIVELKLGLIPIPIVGMLEEEDIDGFLTRDLKSICIDQDLFLNARRETRRRFTYAHEIGHLVLHRKEVQQCDFRTPEDWKHLHQDFLQEDLNWFESQAKEFAGRLLVPRLALESQVRGFSKEIEAYRRKGGNDEDAFIEVIAHEICKPFLVSPECLARRIRKEHILNLLRRRR